MSLAKFKVKQNLSNKEICALNNLSNPSEITKIIEFKVVNALYCELQRVNKYLNNRLNWCRPPVEEFCATLIQTDLLYDEISS